MPQEHGPRLAELLPQGGLSRSPTQRREVMVDYVIGTGASPTPTLRAVE